MEVNKISIKFKGKSDWFYVVPIGDIHLGNACCDIEKLQEMVEWVKKNKNVYWIGMGDYVDCINYSDKRFDPNTIDKKYMANLSNCVSMQIEDIIAILAPIADKCIGLHRGNHEETIRLRYQYDVMYKMWEAFKKPLLKDSAMTRLCFDDGKGHRSAFEIFSTHGSCGGRKGGAKINRLEDMITFADADVYLMGHNHIKATETKSTLYLDHQMNLKVKKRILAVTGCFLHGYKEGITSYIEKWGFPPTDIGVVKLMFNPRKHDVHISE